MFDRRTLLLGAAAIGTGGLIDRTAAQPPRPGFAPILAGLGRGGRLGLFAVDTGSGRWTGHDSYARYAMCSTFKLPLAASVLVRVERGEMRLDEEISFGAADLLPHAPVAEANVARGRMTVEQMCAAIVEVSDNSAANLLLRRTGGPMGLTGFIRACGDGVTRLDRDELELNSNLPDDPRDTTTPAAMLGLMRTLLLGEVLTPASRARLAGWMERSVTGRDRLRAGLPADWRVGDKTGTGARGAANDIAIAWPPGRAPILIASYLSAPEATPAARNAAHAAVARLIAAALA